MAANVETLFVTRQPAWHGLGTILPVSPTSEDAIVASGLDWTVTKEPIFDANGKQIDNYFANTRDKDNSVLGIVSGRYEIIQNIEAFSFTDSLVDEGLTYESAGSLCSGKVIFLLGKLPRTTILGESLEPYVCLSNSFDGSGSVKVVCCHTRVVCWNTLNIALKEATRRWSVRHTGDLSSKLDQARTTLGLVNNYTSALQREAERLSNIRITDADVEHILDEMFPINSDCSDRQKTNIISIKENYFSRLQADDIAQYKGTAYSALMAATDYADHSQPIRKTPNFQQNRWFQIIQGHPFVDTVYSKLVA